MEELAQQAAETLQMAKRFGKVVLVTNAECGWIELSCRKFMPSLYPHLEDIETFIRDEILRYIDLNDEI